MQHLCLHIPSGCSEYPSLNVNFIFGFVYLNLLSVLCSLALALPFAFFIIIPASAGFMTEKRLPPREVLLTSKFSLLQNFLLEFFFKKKTFPVQTKTLKIVFDLLKKGEIKMQISHHSIYLHFKVSLISGHNFGSL